MVKGNWERRAELAALRRTKDKAKKADRKAGVLRCTAEAVASRLVAHSRLDVALLTAWVRDGSSGAAEEDTQGLPYSNICNAHFRSFEGCSLKRCKKVHPDVTVGHLRTLNSDTADGSSVEVPLVGVSLRDLPPGAYHTIHFIGCDGRCVYDWQHTATWKNYLHEQAQDKVLLHATAGLRLGFVEEEEEDKEDKEDSDGDEGGAGDSCSGSAGWVGDDGCDAAGHVSDDKSPCVQGPLHRFLLVGPRGAPSTLEGSSADAAVSCLASYLDARSLAQFRCCSLGSRRCVQVDTMSRRRLREEASSYAVKLVKQKRETKRKKQKQGHMNVSDKKDGFKSKYCSKR